MTAPAVDILEQPDLVDLLCDAPELLAVADAIAQTQVAPPRNSRRVRRPRRVLLLAALVSLLLAPAAWAAVRAFEGTPAPQVIQQNFSYNRVTVNPTTGSILDFLPAADASKAHGVLQLQTSDGPLDLWAAPETHGNGTCWFVGWESDINIHAIGTGACTDSNDAAITPETYKDASHPSYTLLVGSVTGPETTLDVTLTDDSTTTLPVAEHLFLGALPPGSQLASITGRDATGNVVASWTPSP
jgi:hypothetical protein